MIGADTCNLNPDHCDHNTNNPRERSDHFLQKRNNLWPRMIFLQMTIGSGPLLLKKVLKITPVRPPLTHFNQP